MAASSIDWLPYVDAPVDDADYAAAKALVESQVHTDASTGTLHPSMRDMPDLKPSALTQDLLDRASRGEKLSAIDMARYESGALEPPTSSPSDPDHLQHWSDAIDRAAALHSYLDIRSQHLSLLESYGKNAWLIGNDQVETDLKALEKQLAETKEQLDQVEAQRRYNQESSKAEIEALKAEWRRRVVDKTKTEIATAEIYEEIARLKSG